jgi:hypothetical protein
MRLCFNLPQIEDLVHQHPLHAAKLQKALHSLLTSQPQKLGHFLLTQCVANLALHKFHRHSNKLPPIATSLPRNPSSRAITKVTAEISRPSLSRTIQQDQPRATRLRRKLTKHRSPLRLIDLDRMMQHIAPEQSLFPLRPKNDRRMIDAVPWSWNKRDALEHFSSIDSNQLIPSSLENRRHTIEISTPRRSTHRSSHIHRRSHRLRAAVFIVQPRAISLFHCRKHIRGIWKRRNPHPILIQSRIPPNMILMQMRQEHIIHLLRFHTFSAEPIKKRSIKLMKHRRRRMVLPIANTGVNQDGVFGSPHKPRVHAQNNVLHSRRTRSRRNPIRTLAQSLSAQARQQSCQTEARKIHLRNLRDRHISNSIVPRLAGHTVDLTRSPQTSIPTTAEMRGSSRSTSLTLVATRVPLEGNFAPTHHLACAKKPATYHNPAASNRECK